MTDTQIALLVGALVLLALLAAVVVQTRKRNRLRQRFGPEYERAVQRADDRRAAERELTERAQRREQLDIRPLEPRAREAFALRWRTAQEDFVDRPALAVRQADLLVAEVMSARGYPVGDFDQQARDVSVDHAHVVQEYRAAHAISERNDAGQASTEDLRQAMVHYRALFTDLLGDDRADDDRRSDRDRRHEDVPGATGGRTSSWSEDRRYEDRRFDEEPHPGQLHPDPRGYATDEDAPRSRDDARHHL